MKVLHVIPSLSPSQGGPSFALPLIARGLVERGIAVDIATTNDDGPGRRLDVPLGVPVERDGFRVRYFQKQTQFYKVSLPFTRWMRLHVSDYDVVHIHALFSHTSISAARQARRAEVPYIVRPIGVLNRWGMRNRRRLIKALSFRFIEGPLLRHAAAMHYTSRQEQCEAEQAGAFAPAAVIPLGVEMPESPSPSALADFTGRFPSAGKSKVVLFLSRLDVKKGLDLLLPAFAALRQKHADAILMLAGDGQPEYVASLRQMAERLELGASVVWAGFLEGEAKRCALASASVFVLPSYSENFGIALVEALAMGLPAITTPGVAVAEDIRAHDAGLVVPAEIETLTEAMDRVLGEGELRGRLSTNGKELAVKQFSLEAMGRALEELYLKMHRRSLHP